MNYDESRINGDELLTITDILRIFRITRQTLQNWRYKGLGGAYLLLDQHKPAGRRFLICTTAREAARFLAEGYQARYLERLYDHFDSNGGEK